MSNGEFEKTVYTSCFSGATVGTIFNTYDDFAIRYASLEDATRADGNTLIECKLKRFE